MDELKKYPAMVKWFQQSFGSRKDGIELGAFYIIDCLKVRQDSIFWELLAKTGDKTYDMNTFKKLSYNILNA